MKKSFLHIKNIISEMKTNLTVELEDKVQKISGAGVAETEMEKKKEKILEKLIQEMQYKNVRKKYIHRSISLRKTSLHAKAQE